LRSQADSTAWISRRLVRAGIAVRAILFALFGMIVDSKGACHRRWLLSCCSFFRLSWAETTTNTCSLTPTQLPKPPILLGARKKGRRSLEEPAPISRRGAFLADGLPKPAAGFDWVRQLPKARHWAGAGQEVGLRMPPGKVTPSRPVPAAPGSKSALRAAGRVADGRRGRPS
jgi:hypothetical protein